MTKIYRKDLMESTADVEGPPRITNCQDVASYNWLNKGRPTILVPGAPAEWKPPSQSTQLLEDSGQYFRDPNAARYPSYPMQPAVEAVFMEHPNFPTASIDIVACGSTLGNLLRFIQRTGGKFRFIVEAVGSTVFFVRRENTPTELIPRVVGYGHAFPEAYTMWTEESKGSRSHQRIVRYNFAGLDCLVRFQSDGFFPDRIPKDDKGPDESKGNNNSNDDLSAIFSGLDVSEINTTVPAQDNKLDILAGGERIPSSAVFDLKTRTIGKKHIVDTLGQEIQRLWIAQIPNFVLAFHDCGWFDRNEIHIRDVREDVMAWEKDHQAALLEFAVLLQKIVALVRSSRDTRLEIYRESEEGPLELRQACEDVQPTLPEDLANRWILGPQGNEHEHEHHFSPEAEQEISLIEWSDSDEGSVKDLTACSADCGYCGHCGY